MLNGANDGAFVRDAVEFQKQIIKSYINSQSDMMFLQHIFY